MENEGKESLKTRLKNGVMAIAILLGLSAAVLVTQDYHTDDKLIASLKTPKQDSTQTFKFETAIYYYRDTTGLFNFDTTAVCTVIPSEVRFNQRTFDLDLTLGDSKFSYVSRGVEPNGYQIIAHDKDHEGAVTSFSRYAVDSTTSVLAIVNDYIFIILSPSRTECVTIYDLIDSSGN